MELNVCSRKRSYDLRGPILSLTSPYRPHMDDKKKSIFFLTLLECSNGIRKVDYMKNVMEKNFFFFPPGSGFLFFRRRKLKKIRNFGKSLSSVCGP